jgi:hypothetical protein
MKHVHTLLLQTASKGKWPLLLAEALHVSERNVYSTAIDFYFQFWFQHALGLRKGWEPVAPPVRGVYI